MTPNAPLVSVIVPIHNAAAYLDRAREMLLGLDRSVDYEFIVINDHSSDDSLSQIRNWPGSFPYPVTVLQANGRGVAAARNQALRSCHGDFVWLTDADDAWSATIVADMLTEALTSDADIVICNAVKKTPAGATLGRIMDAHRRETTDGEMALLRLLRGELQGHLWNKLFARATLGTDPFPETGAHSDLGGMLRILSRARVVAYLPSEAYVYFQNPGSIIQGPNYPLGSLEACLHVAKEAVAAHPPRPELTEAWARFTFQTVVIPTLSAIAGRLAHLDARTRRSELQRVKRLTSWKLVSQLRGATSTTTLLRSALATLSPRTYVAVYWLSGRASSLPRRRKTKRRHR